METRCLLTQSNRVKQSKHFSYLFQKGRRLEGSFIRIVTAPSYYDYQALAFVTSKKIGKAVYRNAVKRKIKEIIRLNQTCTATLYDYVFIAKPRIRQATYSTLEAEIISLLKKQQLWLNM